MAKETVIFEADLSNGDRLRVVEGPFKGKRYVSIRRWWYDNEGELQPGKGISVELGPDVRLLEEACKAFVAWADTPEAAAPIAEKHEQALKEAAR